MPYVGTTAVRKIAQLDKRVRVIQGGARAGKSFAILMILIAVAQDPRSKGKVISIVSETVPHLKRGVMRDFKNILSEHGYWKQQNWNASDFIYTFETGAIIEFFSADSSAKVRGPARDILFINECNNLSYETYTQLILRTREYAYLDYNPVAEFWVHTEVVPRDDAEMIILTYKDNEGLSQAIIDEIESRKANKNFWQVFGLGLIGEVEGKIYKDWQIIDSVPHEARLEARGLDFGYANDPNGLVAVYYYNGGYILDEELYQRGMFNKQIAETIKNLPNYQTLVTADSAEPKSIDEMREYGINIIGAKKGQGSVSQGIQYVQAQKISVTKNSLNLIKAYRNYMWQTDKEGKILPKPDHYLSDLMDATRYALESLRPREEEDTDFDTSNNLSEYMY